MGRKGGLLGLLGATLVGASALFGGANEAKAQSVDLFKLGTYSPNALSSQVKLIHKNGANEGAIFVNEDTPILTNPPNPGFSYSLKVFTFIDNFRLSTDARGLNSQSKYNNFLYLKNIDGNSSFNLNHELDFTDIFDETVFDNTRNYIARFNIYKESTGQAQDYVLIKKVVEEDIINTLPNLSISNLAEGQEVNYGYVDISTEFKTQTASTSEDVAKVIDLSANQVSGLTYQLVNSPTGGSANISGSTLTYTPNSNYNGPDSFKYNLLFGGNVLGDVTYNLTINAVNDSPIVSNPIGNKSAQYGSSFSFSVPSNTFSDVDGNALTYSVNGLPSGITFNTGSTNFTGTPTASGNYSVNLIATDTSGLKATNNFNLDVAKVSLTATADNKSRAYGDANPTFTGGLVGIVNSDNITANRTTSAGLTSSIGDYAINVAFVDPNNKVTNYNTTLTPGNLTVNKANLSITSDGKSKIYGASNPVLTFTFSGLKNSDPITASGSVGADSTSTVGNYSINLFSLTDISNKLPNYNVTTNNAGFLTINKANVNVTADNKTKIYAQANPAFTASYSGFVNGENSSVISGTPNFSSSVVTGSSVNNYSITPTVGSLAAVNYSFSFIPGNITVNKANLDVRASDAVRLYGGSNPTFTYTFEGLVNGDTASAVSGTATTSSPTATTSSPIGDYTINISQGSMTSANYSFNNFFAGNLHINPATLNVTTSNTNRTYGSANPNLDNLVTVTGTVNGDSITKSATTTALTSSSKGNYPITPSVSGSTNNYTLNLSSGTLTVDPATLTVSSDNKSRNYGEVNPNLTGSIIGIKNSDNLSLTFDTSAKTNSQFGSYPINININDPSNKLSNYNTSTNLGNLTVGKANLNVGTFSTNTIFGENIPVIPTFINGLVNGENVNVVGSTTATNRTPVGSYTTSVNLSGTNLESILSNYNLSTNLAPFVVNSRGVSLFANGITNQYGNVPPTVSWGISNLVAPDTIESFSGSPVINNNVTPFTLAGTNAINITPGSLTNSNYSITNSSGANVVTTTAPITFNILGTNVIYKGNVPDLSVTTSGAKNGESIVGIAGTTATNGSPAGSYPTFLTGINGPSQFDLRYGPITTNANPVNVSARGLELRFVNASVPYGDVVNLGTNWQVNGLQAGDNTTGNPIVTSSAVQGVNVGNYPGNISLGGLNAGPNYAFTNVVSGQVNVVPRTSSVNVEGFTRGYGDTNPPVNVIASNLYAPDGIVASAVPTVGTNSNSGVYTNAFNLDLGPINKLGNYNFVSTNIGDINITNANLVVNADDKNKLYGDVNPVLTGGISGLKNADNITPFFTTTALQNSAIGEFPITIGLNDSSNRLGNYNISTNNGKLTVGKASLNVISDNKNMLYGGSVPALTGNIQGLKNGSDGISLGYSTLASPLVNVGNYPVEISVNDPSNRLSNYLVSTNKGNVNVGKAPLLVKGKDVSRLYGDPNPPLETIVTGGVNGNTFVTDATTTATLTSGIGEYPVKPSISGSNTNNYNISLEDGKMNVNKAPLSVTVGNGNHIYGSFPQTVSASASGVRNGDSIVVNSVNPATQISNVGNYTTTATLSGDKLTNYAPNITVGNYGVLPATLNVVAEDKLKRNNENNPVLTFNAAGYKLGQGNEVFTVSPSLFTSATNGSPAGDYAINISGGNALNYSLNYANGNLKVLNNIVPPVLTGIGVNNGLVNLVGNVFADNPNGMKLTSMYSDNLNSTNWLPSGITNMIYSNVVNGTNSSQNFGINLTNQISSGRFYKLKLEDNK